MPYYYTLDDNHTSPSDVLRDNDLNLGSVQIDHEYFHFFRLVNETSHPITTTIKLSNNYWFSFTKWNLVDVFFNEREITVAANSISDPIWIRTEIPLDATLTPPYEERVMSNEFGELGLSFVPVDVYAVYRDPYPDFAGQETENLLQYWERTKEAATINLYRYDPLPVPPSDDDIINSDFYELRDRQVAEKLNPNNGRIGYRIHEPFRAKVFLGNNLPQFAAAETRLAPDMGFRGEAPILLPANQWLARSWAYFGPIQDDPYDGKYKMTHYIFAWSGLWYAVEGLVPVFTFTNILAYLSARAIPIQYPAAAKQSQYICYNRLYRDGDALVAIDSPQSFIPLLPPISSIGSAASIIKGS